jgi:hypothetical protein
MKKKSPSKKNVSETGYYIELDTNGVKYTGVGTSVLEALESMDVPPKLSNKAIVRASHGKKHTEILLPVFPLRRLFSNSIRRLMWSKWVELRLR